MSDLLRMSERALSEAEYEHREAIYEAMERLLEPLEMRAVLVVFEPGTIDAHVMTHVPGGDEPAVLLAGQQALYALSLYTMELEARLKAMQDAAQRS